MSMHQFVPKFANENKCNDCHEDKSVHDDNSYTWIDEVLSKFMHEPTVSAPDNGLTSSEVKFIILDKLAEAYKKGYIDGSIKEITAKN